MARRARSATEPTQAQAAHSETVAAAHAALGAFCEGGLESIDRYAIRYLESSRLFPLVPRAPLRPEEMTKLAEAQADVMVDVIEAVLAGLQLSPDQYEYGRKLASDALAAVATEGWGPL